MKTIKTVAAILVALAVITGAGWLVNDRYQQYKTNQATAAKAHADAVDDAVLQLKTSSDARYAKLQTAYDALRIECEKGAASYAVLTPTIKAKTAAPDCGPAVAAR